jgi:hypothetical protein
MAAVDAAWVEQSGVEQLITYLAPALLTGLNPNFVSFHTGQ